MANGESSKPWKNRVIIPVELDKLKTLSLEGKINYLAKCGWRIEIEERSGNKYMYAVKYIERKKRRIYLAAESEYKSL